MKIDIEQINELVEIDLDGYLMDPDDPEAVTECFELGGRENGSAQQ